MWCQRSGEYYILDNIPFIAKNISYGDTFAAEYDDTDGKYYFDHLVEESGNSTIRVLVFDKKEYQEVIEELHEKFKLETEELEVKNIIIINVEKDQEYRPIWEYLRFGEDNGRFTFQESCLAHARE